MSHLIMGTGKSRTPICTCPAEIFWGVRRVVIQPNLCFTGKENECWMSPGAAAAIQNTDRTLEPEAGYSAPSQARENNQSRPEVISSHSTPPPAMFSLPCVSLYIQEPAMGYRRIKTRLVETMTPLWLPLVTPHLHMQSLVL